MCNYIHDEAFERAREDAVIAAHVAPSPEAVVAAAPKLLTALKGAKMLLDMGFPKDDPCYVLQMKEIDAALATVETLSPPSFGEWVSTISLESLPAGGEFLRNIYAYHPEEAVMVPQSTGHLVGWLWTQPGCGVLPVSAAQKLFNDYRFMLREQYNVGGAA